MPRARQAVEFLKRFRAPRDIRRYLASHESPRLNVGCGGNIVGGWLNVDMEPAPGAVYVDLTRPWPFSAGAFAAVLSEHVIEHISRSAGDALLREAHRVLSSGGVIRVVTPDLGFLASLSLGRTDEADSYLQAIRRFLGRPTLSTCDAVNVAFREYGHTYIYSVDELRSAVEAAGFVDIVVTRAGQPKAPIFAGAEGHGGVIGDEINAIEAFAVEARKP